MKTSRSFIYLTIFSIIVITWLLYDNIYSTDNHFDWYSLSDRIAFVSMWVSLIGFGLAIFGVWIAVLEFQKGQRKPMLILWMNEIGKNHVSINSHRKDIKLILHNKGKGVGRFFRIDILVPSSDSIIIPNKPEIKIVHHPPFFAWDRTDSSSKLLTYTFTGIEKIISYREDPMPIGIIKFKFQNESVMPKTKKHYTLKYIIRCEGMNKKEGNLTLAINE